MNPPKLVAADRAVLDASPVVVDASPVVVDASLAVVDASLAVVDASLAVVDASLAIEELERVCAERPPVRLTNLSASLVSLRVAIAEHAPSTAAARHSDANLTDVAITSVVPTDAEDRFI